MNRNVYATILVILAIGLYFTVTRLIIADATVVLASNTEYIAAIESAKSLITLRDQVRDDYNKLSAENRARLDKIVPRSIDNIRLIIDLNNVAMQHGFSLKGIQATAATNDKTKSNAVPDVAMVAPGNDQGFANINSPIIPAPILDKVTVTFSVNAPYQQFISFLQDLEASLRILDVSNLTVSASENGVYTWKVELQTYWLRSQ